MVGVLLIRILLYAGYYIRVPCFRSLGLQVYDRGLSRVWGLPKVTKVPEMK